MNVRTLIAAALALFAGTAAAETLEDRLLAELIVQGAPADGAVALVGRRPGNMDGFEIESAAYDPESQRFSAAARDEKGRLLRLQGRVEEGVDLPVLGRDMASGEAVATDDIVLIRIARSQLLSGTVTDPLEIEGRVAKRKLKPGVALRAGDLMKPLVVRKGDAVTIAYDAPGISLSVRGKALKDGAAGDTIEIENIMSKKKVEAVVTGAGAVSVSPPGGLAMN
jgi:flagella basal body P-ring formation protein FlgA